MKNLFKNLMLVAVAAMAFTACQKDNEDVNRVNETTVVEFKAEFDTTRSGFGDKEDDKGYSSHWDGGEVIYLEVNSTNPNVAPTMEEDGTFKAEFTKGSISDEGTITALIPYDSWKYDHSVSEMAPSIPGTQTPVDGSVDPAAHILKAEKAFDDGLGGVHTLAFTHQVAYAKMTLDTTVAIDQIAQVIVEIDAQRYTLDPTNLTEPTFWFACKEATPAAMTVTITDKNETNYVKELNLAAADKKLAFTTGRVASFTVGGFEEVVIEDVLQVRVEHTFFYVELKEGVLMLDTNHFTWDANGFLEEQDYDGSTSDYGWNWIPGATIATRFDYNDWYKITNASFAIAQLDKGYEFNMFWSSDNVPEKYDYYGDGDGLTYTGIIEGINNPPVPEAVTETTTPASVSGRATSDAWDYTYYLSFVAGAWTIEDLYFYAPGLSSNGIIPEATYEIRGGTATITDTTWTFDITTGTVKVEHSDENYVLTFNFEVANGSSFELSFTGVIEGKSGIFQPGAVTPLATPSNVAYELVNFSNARITWNAVAGAGSYKLYYNDGENDSEPVTTENNYYVFDNFTTGKYYSVYVKAIPADAGKNTESENYARVDNVKVFAYHGEMATTYTFTTVEKTGKNTFKFSDGVDNIVIGFPQDLENVPAGTYFGGFESGMIRPYDCSFNDSGINSIDYVIVEGNYGEEQTVTMVISVTSGQPSIKAVFTGVLEEESNVEPVAATSFTFLGDWNTVYNTTNAPSGVYKVIGENFDIDLAIHYTGYNKETGAFNEGTYTYSYNGGYYPGNGTGYIADNFLYEGNFTFAGTFNGNALTYNYDSTLVVDGSGITLTLAIDSSVAAIITWSGQPTK